MDGVAARTSATKSAIVKSTSWPTAEITGTGQATIARATAFAVEGLQILGGSAAAADDHDVDLRHTHDRAQRPDEIDRRIVALHPGGADDDPGGRMPPRQDAQDVAKRRPVERRDDADAPRQHRQRPLARGVEQSFGLQLALQLLERRLQRAEPLRLERVDDDWYSPFTS